MIFYEVSIMYCVNVLATEKHILWVFAIMFKQFYRQMIWEKFSNKAITTFAKFMNFHEIFLLCFSKK